MAEPRTIHIDGPEGGGWDIVLDGERSAYLQGAINLQLSEISKAMAHRIAKLEDRLKAVVGPPVEREKREQLLFNYLCRAYVQRAAREGAPLTEDGQALQYTTAETHDLARNLARVLEHMLEAERG